MKENLLKSEWFLSRPRKVQEKIIDFPPDYFYKLKSTGQKVRLYSYSENKKGCETCSVLVLAKDNPGRTDVERNVFGIPFDDLERLSLIPSHKSE